MKSKFVLTEEESKRILSLHKEKIQEEKVQLNEAPQGGQLNKKEKTVKLVKKIPLVGVDIDNRVNYNDELALIAGATFKPTDKGNLAATVEVENPETGRRSNKYVVYYCWPNHIRRDKNTPRKFQVGKKLYFSKGGFANAIQTDAWEDLCAGLKYVDGDGKVTPTPTPTKKGCPSIVKSFTDAGYTQITEKRYKELAGDNTRVRKYKFCPVTKKNLYFAKMKTGGTDNTDNTGTTGGGATSTTGGERYPFDYNTVLAAINKKCPGGGGGGGTSPEEEEEIINPFGQGEQTPAQVITITDKIYDGIN